MSALTVEVADHKLALLDRAGTRLLVAVQQDDTAQDLIDRWTEPGLEPAIVVALLKGVPSVHKGERFVRVVEEQVVTTLVLSSEELWA